MSTPEPTPPSDANDLPALSVRRPLLALVLNLLIALAGLAAILAVEVRELPNVDRPIVSVRGILQGASPETMDREVTSIVEGAVARVNGVREIQSSSEENNFRMRVEFDPSADLDLAAADVREAVSRVQRELPDNVEQLAVVKADADASPILRLAVQGDGLRDEDLARIVENDIIPELISVDGVADVTLFGDRERQLRVVLDPLRLSSYQLSASDVIDVLENAPFDIPAGSFGSEDQELIVRADATVETASNRQGSRWRAGIESFGVWVVISSLGEGSGYARDILAGALGARSDRFSSGKGQRLPASSLVRARAGERCGGAGAAVWQESRPGLVGGAGACRDRCGAGRARGAGFLR